MSSRYLRNKISPEIAALNENNDILWFYWIKLNIKFSLFHLPAQYYALQFVIPKKWSNLLSNKQNIVVFFSSISRRNFNQINWFLNVKTNFDNHPERKIIFFIYRTFLNRFVISSCMVVGHIKMLNTSVVGTHCDLWYFFVLVSAKWLWHFLQSISNSITISIGANTNLVLFRFAKVSIFHVQSGNIFLNIHTVCDYFLRICFIQMGCCVIDQCWMLWQPKIFKTMICHCFVF